MRMWSAILREFANSKWALTCFLIAAAFFMLDGFTISGSSVVAFSWCGCVSFPLVGILARRIALTGRGHWTERLAIPVICLMGILWLENSLYPIENTLLWFTLSFIVSSLGYFALIFAALYRRKTRFVDADGKLTDAFYVIKTLYTFIVWMASIFSLTAGELSYSPPYISVSFAGTPILLAVLALEMSLRHRNANEYGAKVRFSFKFMRGWSAACLLAAGVSVILILVQFQRPEEIANYVPDHPLVWVGWVSFIFIALFSFIAFRPRAGFRWLAILMIYVWAFYGHFALNVNYSSSPETQIYTIIAILLLYVLIIAASLWRARHAFLDGDGKINGYFEYLKSIASGYGWIMATVVVLILSRLHQSTMRVVLWGGIPLSVAPLILAIFGMEYYLLWTAISKNMNRQEKGALVSKPGWRRLTLWLWSSPLLLLMGLNPIGFKVLGGLALVCSAVFVYHTYNLKDRNRWSFLILGWFWSALGIYFINVQFDQAGVSLALANFLTLPVYTAFHMTAIWRQRKDLVNQGGQIGEGFLHYKAMAVCVSWLFGTVAFILYKVWLMFEDSSPLLIASIPLAIAPMINGLYLMEAWFRSRQDRMKTVHNRNGLNLNC
ncbi:hypothetical protein ACFPPD_05545 [Cohnella suwonensis]|uniref:Permease n=1 Tax=Cohnella suwonensis TaxID=696072 RepID=A0ABW0LT69_9BACL